MRYIFSLLCISLMFFACDGSSTSNNGDSADSGENPSSGSGDGGGSGESLGAYLALPSNMDKSAITEKYEAWMQTYYATYQDDVNDGSLPNVIYAKEGLEDAARIRWVSDGKSPSLTVSEGIGYGMLLAALNGDFEGRSETGRFDKLWRYHKAYRAYGTNLMIWRITSFREPSDSGIATDADIDVCAALYIAYKKTGNSDYLNDFLAIGKSLYDHTLGSDNLLLPAIKNATELSNGNVINISYMSLVVFKLLADNDPSNDWNSVLNANIEYMQMVQNKGDGLWPDWSNLGGDAVNPGNSSCDTLIFAENDGSTGRALSCFVYQKESFRTPWRIAWYYHWFGDSRAKEMLDKAFAFISGKTNSDIENIMGWYGYNDGKVGKDKGGVATWASLCATGLGSENNSSWNSACNNKLLIRNLLKNNYYYDSLFLLYFMLFNGNFEI